MKTPIQWLTSLHGGESVKKGQAYAEVNVFCCGINICIVGNCLKLIGSAQINECAILCLTVGQHNVFYNQRCLCVEFL